MNAPAALSHYQRLVRDALFASKPEGAIAELSSRTNDPSLSAERWRLYREMTRSRMTSTLETALPRSARHSRGAFGSLVERWLHETPPSSPLMRDVVSDASRWLEAYVPESNETLPPFWKDVVSYERALLEIGWTEEPDLLPIEPSELQFDKVPVLAPIRRALVLSWNVESLDRDPPEAGELEPTPEAHVHALIVFRSVTSGAVDTRVLEGFSRALYNAIEQPARSLVESVRAAAQTAGRAVEGALLEELSQELSAWMDAGLWAGCRA